MSYEQMPSYFPSPEELPKDGNKRIFVGKGDFPTQRDRDAQMARLRRVGYEPDVENSNQDADCLVISEEKDAARKKAREEDSKKKVMAAPAAGISGEDPELSGAKILGPQNPEQFFEGKEQLE